ncbi:MAG: hypothetical protein WDO56_00120 [Gammaproteobacteria bacterium]
MLHEKFNSGHVRCERDERGNLIYFNADNQIHRLDGPAIIAPDMTVWYRNGLMHREDGPALETAEIKMWFRDGIKHREDGPAVVTKNDVWLSDRCSWWLNGRELTEDEFNSAPLRSSKTKNDFPRP